MPNTSTESQQTARAGDGRPPWASDDMMFEAPSDHYASFDTGEGTSSSSRGPDPWMQGSDPWQRTEWQAWQQRMGSGLLFGPPQQPAPQQPPQQPTPQPAATPPQPSSQQRVAPDDELSDASDNGRTTPPVAPLYRRTGTHSITEQMLINVFQSNSLSQPAREEVPQRETPGLLSRNLPLSSGPSRSAVNTTTFTRRSPEASVSSLSRVADSINLMRQMRNTGQQNVDDSAGPVPAAPTEAPPPAPPPPPAAPQPASEPTSGQNTPRDHWARPATPASSQTSQGPPHSRRKFRQREWSSCPTRGSQVHCRGRGKHGQASAGGL